MSNFKKIVPFIYPYKKYAYLNIFFNVLYALFSTLSFIALIPMLQVLFDKTKENKVKPVFEVPCKEVNTILRLSFAS